MTIKGLAFDLEGTAVDAEAAHHKGHIATAAEFGLVMTFDEALTNIPHLIGGPREKVCEEILNLLNVKAPLEEIVARDEFHYERLLAGMSINHRPGFIDFCRIASRLGLKLAIGSVTPAKHAEILLERSGIGKFFGEENIVLREHVKNEKPAPDVFLKTAEIMGINPKEQLVFEDSPRGVKAAIAAGSKVIAMPVIIRGSTVRALIDAGAIRIFFDWREINLPALIENI